MFGSGFKVSAVPFLRLVIPLCVGIGIFHVYPVFHPLQLVALLLVVIFLLVCFKEISFRFQSCWGALLMLAMVVFGFLRASKQSELFPLLTNQQYFAVLDDYPKEKEKTFQLICQLLPSGGKVITYLPKLPAVGRAKPGDLISFDGLPELMQNEGNPFEFDYCGYLHRQNIGYRIFLKENKICFIQDFSLLNIQRRALILRQKLIEILYKSGIGRNQVQLIASISFGARDDVDKETIQSFTNTGVIHVLAVSGMNVGLIFVILDYFLLFLKSWRRGRYLHLLIILAGIWGYSLITGMSPSILRAATMFSIVLIGNTLHRNSNIFNSLAASAFLLISFDPSMLLDAGFQLSYAAVLAILILQPLLFGLLHFHYSFFEKIWELLSVTIAAQFGTLPLTLYYFHQFPVYFLLANLVVIPLVTFILYLSIVVILFSLLSGFITCLLGVVLDWSVRLVLFFVDFTANLPQSVIRGLYPTICQILITCLLIFLFYGFYKTRKLHLLKAGLFMTILLTISLGLAAYKRIVRDELVIFNVPGSRVLSITNGPSTLVLYDSCQASRERMEYYLKPYLATRGIRKVKWFRISDSLRIVRPSVSVVGHFIFFEGSRIYLQSADTEVENPPDEELCADLVWMREFGVHPSRQIFIPKSKVVLFRTTRHIGNMPPFKPPQEGIDLTKAVQLCRSTSIFGSRGAMICRYFTP